MLECVEEINESKRFGQTNPKTGTYIDHQDKELNKNYLKRHLKDLETNDYKRAGYLSMFLLWNKPTLKESMKDLTEELKKMIGIYNID